MVILPVNQIRACCLRGTLFLRSSRCDSSLSWRGVFDPGKTTIAPFLIIRKLRRNIVVANKVSALFYDTLEKRYLWKVLER